MLSNRIQFKISQNSELGIFRKKLIDSQQTGRFNSNKRDLTDEETNLLVKYINIFAGEVFLQFQIESMANQVKEGEALDLTDLRHSLKNEIFDFLENLIVKKIITTKSIYQLIIHPNLNLNHIILNLINCPASEKGLIWDTLDLHLRTDAFLGYIQLIVGLAFEAGSYEEAEKVIGLLMQQEGNEHPQSFLKYFFESPSNLVESFFGFLEALKFLNAHTIIKNILSTTLLDSPKPIYIRLLEHNNYELSTRLSELLEECVNHITGFQLATLPQTDYLFNCALATNSGLELFSILKLNVFDDKQLQKLKDKKELIRDYLLNIRNETDKSSELKLAIIPENNTGKLLLMKRGFAGLFNSQNNKNQGVYAILKKAHDDLEAKCKSLTTP